MNWFWNEREVVVTASTLKATKPFTLKRLTFSYVNVTSTKNIVFLQNSCGSCR